jgi:2-keto-4-pentenoate hydratase
VPDSAMSSNGPADPVARGMRTLLAHRSSRLEAGATAVGWKVGLNVPALQQHFGLDGPVVGYLTDSTVCQPGAPVDIGPWVGPALEVEVAIRIGDDGGVAALAPAIELVDLDLPFDDLEPILEGNIFHRGVIFGPERGGLTLAELAVRVTQDGRTVAEGRLVETPETTVEVVRTYLSAHGAALVPGDRIIAGSLITPMAIAPGDRLEVDYGVLGSLSVSFT